MKRSKQNNPRKKCNRRSGKNVLGNGKNAITKADAAPGDHGRERRRGTSAYAIQLREKQCLKYFYGHIKEGQFQKIFLNALRAKGSTKDVFVQLLESRIDVVIYRMNMVPTMYAARQAVSHGHVTVNGKKVDIASYIVKAGDNISLKDSSKNLKCFVGSVQKKINKLPDYIEFDSDSMSGVFLGAPESHESVSYPFHIEFDKIVEFYSR